MQNFTFDELSSFGQNETKWLNELTSAMKKTMSQAASIEPSKEVVRRISDYNKAFSSKRSTKLGTFQLLLN